MSALAADPDELIAASNDGDRRALARAISHVEDDTSIALALLAGFYTIANRAVRIGITGAPGSGKSTLTSELITVIRSQGLSVAVIAIDPSSPFTGGSILADRIRMQHHIGDTGVYIRSMSSRGHLGGLSAATPKVAAVLDGVGFDVVLIETVGVGQAEVEIVGEADTTVVVVTPGWGDSIQANKAGLLEIGDVFVVNKADRPGAQDAVRDLEGMLDLGSKVAWRPPILETTATEGTGVDDLWASIQAFGDHLTSGGLDTRRRARVESTIRRAVRDTVVARLSSGEIPGLSRSLAAVEQGEIDPWTAAAHLVEHITH